METVFKVFISVSTALYILASSVLAMNSDEEGDKNKSASHLAPSSTIPGASQQGQAKGPAASAASSLSQRVPPTIHDFPQPLILHVSSFCPFAMPRVCTRFRVTNAQLPLWRELLKESGHPYDSAKGISPWATFWSLVQPVNGDPTAMRVFANVLVHHSLRKSAVSYFNLVIFNPQVSASLRFDTQIDKNYSGIWDDDGVVSVSQTLLEKASNHHSLQPQSRNRAILLQARRLFELHSHDSNFWTNPHNHSLSLVTTLPKADALPSDYAEALLYSGILCHMDRRKMLREPMYARQLFCHPMHYKTGYLRLQEVSQIPEASPVVRARAQLYMAHIRAETLTNEAMEAWRKHHADPQNSYGFKDFEVIDDATAHRFLVEASQNPLLFPHERDEATRTLELMRQQGRAPTPADNKGGNKPEQKAGGQS